MTYMVSFLRVASRSPKREAMYKVSSGEELGFSLITTPFKDSLKESMEAKDQGGGNSEFQEFFYCAILL